MKTFKRAGFLRHFLSGFALGAIGLIAMQAAQASHDAPAAPAAAQTAGITAAPVR